MDDPTMIVTQVARPTMGETNEIAAALAKAQAIFTVAELDMVNPHFKSRYSSFRAILDACRKGLAANELCLYFKPESNGKTVTVTAWLLHSSGQSLSASLTADARDVGPQALGSIITYLKRYTAAALLGIASGDEADDDGNAAEKESPTIVKATTTTKQKPSKSSTGYDPEDVEHRTAFQAQLAMAGIDDLYWKEASQMMKGLDKSKMADVIREVKRLAEIPM